MILRATVAQLRLELLLTLRRGESVLVTLAVPLLLLLFLGSLPVFGGDPASRVPELVPGLLSLAVMSSGMVSLGIATAFERQYGVLKRLGSSPLTRSQLLIAKALAVLAIVAVQTVLLMGTASVAFGWRPGGSPLVLALFMLLGLAAFAGLGFLMAGTLRAEMALAVANGLYLVLLLLGGVVVPVERLPGPLAVTALALPSAALADVLRTSLGAAQSVSPASVPVLVAWSILAPAAAARLFRWD